MGFVAGVKSLLDHFQTVFLHTSQIWPGAKINNLVASNAILTDECFVVTVNVSLTFKDAYFDVPRTVFHYLCIRPQGKNENYLRVI